MGFSGCDLHSAGLPSASMVRMKLFTLDDRLVIRKAGVLSINDQAAVSIALQQLLCLQDQSDNGFM